MLVATFATCARGLLTRYRVALVAALIGLPLSIAAYLLIAELDRGLAQAKFEIDARVQAGVIQDGLDDYVDGVHALGLYLHVSPDLSFEQYTTFAQDLRAKVRGISALTWTAKVSREERDAFEAKARTTVRPNFEITDNALQGTPRRAAERDVYFPILYTAGERLRTAEKFFGYDEANDPMRQRMFAEARDSGEIITLGPVPVMQENGAPIFGYMIYAPVYEWQQPRESVEQRRAGIKGYVIGVIRIEDAIRQIAQNPGASQDFGMYFYDPGKHEAMPPLYWHPAARDRAQAAVPGRDELLDTPHSTSTPKLANSDLGLIVTPSGPLASGLLGSRALLALLACLTISAIVTIYAVISVRRRVHLETLTQELEASTENLMFGNALLTAATESSPDGILVVDRNNTTIITNKPLARIWNIPPEIIATHDDAKLLQWAKTQLKDVPSFVGRVEYLYRHPEVASEEEIALRGDRWLDRRSRSLFDPAGRYLGRIWFFRDITRRKRAETAQNYRGELLHAVAEAAAELLAPDGLKQSIRKAIEIAGKAVGAHRVLVIQYRQAKAGARPFDLRFAWNAADAPLPVSQDVFARNLDFTDPELNAFFAPLRDGRPIQATRSMPNGGQQLLDRLQIDSLLVVPLMVDGECWGQIGFDDCFNEREWGTIEIDILTALASLIGGAISREERVKALADANRIVENSPTILYRALAKPGLPFVYVSRNVSRLGYDADTLVADEGSHLDYVHPDDRPMVTAWRDAMSGDAEQSGTMEFRLRAADGTYRWVENHYQSLKDENGAATQIEGILVDVTEHKKAEAMIAALARTDALTGLANRRTFLERLEQAVIATKRGASRFAVLSLDLDHFKEVNDTLGHPIGDLLLQAIAERLQKAIRETDLVARFGGDEFMILQTDIEDPAAAGTLAEKIRGVIAAPLMVEGNSLRVSASIGIAAYSPDIHSGETMLAQADVALYRAKEEGRDRYRFHSDEMNADVSERMEMVEDLRGALVRREFVLHYQPLIELGTERLVGMEALLRWNHPRRGMLLPAAFLATAERAGLIVPLGHWVLDEACRQLRDWRAAGIAAPPMTVNLAVGQLKTGNQFIHEVTETLAQYGISAEAIVFDIREATLAGMSQAQAETLEELHRLGVQIAIDDFGSELFSLSYVQKHRVAHLKIGNSIMETAAGTASGAAAFKAIVHLADDLGLGVVAEGVETPDQRRMLISVAPHTTAQGFLFSRPLGTAAATELLRATVGSRIAPEAHAAG